MTTPVASGYPDFGRYQAQATKIYVNTSAAGLVAARVVNLGYVGDVANLGVRILPTAGTCVVDLAFHSNAALTDEIGDHTLSFHAGDLFSRTVPVLGPFLKLTITPVTTPLDIEYRVYQAAGPWAALDNDATGNVLISALNDVNPVGVTNIECSGIQPGPAVFAGQATAANTFIDLNAVSAGGVVTFLSRILNVSGFAHLPLFLPAQHIQISITNNSGAAQFFHYAVTTDIGWG